MEKCTRMAIRSVLVFGTCMLHEVMFCKAEIPQGRKSVSTLLQSSRRGKFESSPTLDQEIYCDCKAGDFNMRDPASVRKT